MTVAQIGPAYVPVAPLRDAILRRHTYESISDMAKRWASWSGRSVKACNRTINYVLHSRDKVSITHVDEICAWVLKLHPINLYGDEW